jgi:hypothetical protein
MGSAIRLLPLWAFMASSGVNFPLPLPKMCYHTLFITLSQICMLLMQVISELADMYTRVNFASTLQLLALVASNGPIKLGLP